MAGSGWTDEVVRVLCGEEAEAERDILAKDCKDSRGEAELGAVERPFLGMCKVIPVGRFKGGSSLKEVEVGENASAAERFEPGMGEGDGGGLTWSWGRIVTFAAENGGRMYCMGEVDRAR